MISAAISQAMLATSDGRSCRSAMMARTTANARANERLSAIRVEAVRRGTGEISMMRLLWRPTVVDTLAGFKRTLLSALCVGTSRVKHLIGHFSSESNLTLIWLPIKCRHIAVSRLVAVSRLAAEDRGGGNACRWVRSRPATWTTFAGPSSLTSSPATGSFAQEVADDARRRLRLFEEEHVRGAFESRIARARDRCGHFLYRFGRRGFVELAGEAERGRPYAAETRQRINRGHGVPRLGPTLDVIGKQPRLGRFLLAACAKCRREPAIERCLDYVTHAALSRIIAAGARDIARLGGQGGAAGADHQCADVLRILQRELLRHHAAKGEADGRRWRERKLCQQGEQVVGIVDERIRRRRRRAVAVPALVDGQHGELVAQVIGHRGEKRQIEANRMQQDDERPVAPKFVIQSIRHDRPRRVDRA